MPDVWATIAELDSTTQERLADMLETRGADPKQQDMRRAFAADINLPTAANVLEVGCGTGVLTRALAGLPEVETIIETGDGGYMLTIIDRGADMLHASGRIGEDLAAALKDEARRRAAAGGFIGHIAYVSVIARRPAG
ncbi:MAG TPA: hypothetical protein VFX51_04565 [Solirubrobacteraceae bacterium]|nr:hypothetical protein [Solirubrobacteraceae bacterium]